MPSQVPIVRSNTNWFFLSIHILFIAFLAYLFKQETTFSGLSIAVICYLLINYILKHTVSRQFFKGMRLVKRGDFERGMFYFQRSVDFFEAHPWVDRYRYITLLAAGDMTFHELSLCNYAFCLSQMGRGKEALLIYEEILAIYPKNMLAITAVRSLSSMQSE